MEDISKLSYLEINNQIADAAGNLMLNLALDFLNPKINHLNKEKSAYEIIGLLKSVKEQNISIGKYIKRLQIMDNNSGGKISESLEPILMPGYYLFN